MGEALRGTRLGTVSYETEDGVEFAPRQPVVYDCPNGHETTVPFSAEAEVPATWECRSCGAVALRRDAEMPEAKAGRRPRTHWDMLMERRTVDDLEELLTERLTLLRGSGGPGEAAHDERRKSA